MKSLIVLAVTVLLSGSVFAVPGSSGIMKKPKASIQKAKTYTSGPSYRTKSPHPAKAECAFKKDVARGASTNPKSNNFRHSTPKKGKGVGEGQYS